MPECPICLAEFRQGLAPWLLRCPGCGFERSTLTEQIADPRSRANIDEAARRQALGALRERNFRTTVGILDKLRPQRGSLLDVGCGHGWFLRAAAESGWRTVGIEPDPEIARLAAGSAQEVRMGSFPSALKPGERFDVISFNDVFEHLSDLAGALQASAAALRPGGLLAINLPDARGVFYRLARLLARARVSGPLERLWQKGFPSPHLSYFTAPLLRRLAAKHGFRATYGDRLPSIALSGLWSRLRYDRRSTLTGSALAWTATFALLPALRLLPSDISLEFFELPPGRP
jgi:SAM-dependent methyltransferase